MPDGDPFLYWPEFVSASPAPRDLPAANAGASDGAPRAHTRGAFRGFLTAADAAALTASAESGAALHALPSPAISRGSLLWPLALVSLAFLAGKSSR